MHNMDILRKRYITNEIVMNMRAGENEGEIHNSEKEVSKAKKEMQSQGLIGNMCHVFPLYSIFNCLPLFLLPHNILP